MLYFSIAPLQELPTPAIQQNSTAKSATSADNLPLSQQLRMYLG
jgi:hypothetical protein